MELNPTDLLIAKQVVSLYEQNEAITSAVIAEKAYLARRTVSETLKNFAEQGWLTGPPGRTGGTKPKVYSLTKRGYEVLLRQLELRSISSRTPLETGTDVVLVKILLPSLPDYPAGHRAQRLMEALQIPGTKSWIEPAHPYDQPVPSELSLQQRVILGIILWLWQRQPGIEINTLERLLKWKAETIRYHLRLLVRQGLVAETGKLTHNGQQIYSIELTEQGYRSAQAYGLAPLW